jgi:LL-diaminopimelate aminotransferase
MRSARRLETVKEYYFSKKLKEIAKLREEGHNVLNLAIGSPDVSPHLSVVQALKHSAETGPNGYQSYQGIPELREAIAKFYKKKYQVVLDPHGEILPLMGSKEGITHISLAYLDQGDTVLVPELGYPTYRSVTEMVESKVINYPLISEKDWEPDWSFFDRIQEKPKILWINYPHMPTGAGGKLEWLERFVALAHKYQMLLVHDNPYSFILNKEPRSIFSISGAKDVAIELNSLSKTFNMAGWRVGWACGKIELLQPVQNIKSNMDSGMYYGIQKAAIAALGLGDDWFNGLNDMYAKRRVKVFQFLDALECTYEVGQQGMFVWAKASQSNGEALVDQLLRDHHIFITPGKVFGEAGDAYVRVSLCSEEAVFDQAIDRIRR